jgi:hypothetical protein
MENPKGSRKRIEVAEKTEPAQGPRRDQRGAAVRQKHPRAAQLVTPLGCVM